jgi:hypothetical protein
MGAKVLAGVFGLVRSRVVRDGGEKGLRQRAAPWGLPLPRKRSWISTTVRGHRACFLLRASFAANTRR